MAETKKKKCVNVLDNKFVHGITQTQNSTWNLSACKEMESVSEVTLLFDQKFGGTKWWFVINDDVSPTFQRALWWTITRNTSSRSLVALVLVNRMPATYWEVLVWIGCDPAGVKFQWQCRWHIWSCLSLCLACQGTEWTDTTYHSLSMQQRTCAL